MRRPKVQAEMGKGPAGQVKSVSLCTSWDDVMEDLHVRVHENETAGAMDESQEAKYCDWGK